MAPPCATDAVGCTEEPALDRSRRPGGLVQRRQIGNMGSGLKRLKKRLAGSFSAGKLETWVPVSKG